MIRRWSVGSLVVALALGLAACVEGGAGGFDPLAGDPTTLEGSWSGTFSEGVTAIGLDYPKNGPIDLTFTLAGTVVDGTITLSQDICWKIGLTITNVAITGDLTSDVLAFTYTSNGNGTHDVSFSMSGITTPGTGNFDNTLCNGSTQKVNDGVFTITKL